MDAGGGEEVLALLEDIMVTLAEDMGQDVNLLQDLLQVLTKYIRLTKVPNEGLSFT